MAPGGSIPTQDPHTPTRSRLEGAVAQLAQREDHRGLVVLVEKWASVDEPSPSARIAQAEAFIALRLLDRAWVRLKEPVERDPPSLDAIEMAANMFLLRGWRNQARKAIARGLAEQPDHPGLQALWACATAEPETSTDDEVLASDAPLADVLRIAEGHMVHGAFVRAQALLERVRRLQPNNPRASELLWAIGGEFTTPQTLAALCGGLTDGPQLGGDFSDDPEHTESVSVQSLGLPPPKTKSDQAFSGLFRNLRKRGRSKTTTPDITERTAVASMADLLPIIAEVDTVDSDGSEDTQILRVVHRDGDGDPDALNLAEPPEQGVSDFLAGAEEEDESVVIVTRRDDPSPPTDPDTGERGLFLDTAVEDQAHQQQGTAEGSFAEAPTVLAAVGRADSGAQADDVPWWIPPATIAMLAAAVVIGVLTLYAWL